MTTKLLRAVLLLPLGGLAACSSSASHASSVTSGPPTSVAPVASTAPSQPDRAAGVAQADVRNALTAELTVFTDNEQFSQAADLSEVIPDVNLANFPTDASSLSPGTVYVAVVNPTEVELSAVAGDNLYTMVQNEAGPNGATYYGRTPAAAGRPDPARVTAVTTSAW